LNDEVVILRDRQGVFYLKVSDLKRWHLRLPDVQAIQRDGELFVPLTELPTLTYRLNPRTLELRIIAPTAAFMETTLDAKAPAYRRRRGVAPVHF
jgi:outer membrane usher protein FimD/PapC